MSVDLSYYETEYTESNEDLDFREYEMSGVSFPGLGLTYSDFAGVPIVRTPIEKVTEKVRHILTSYAMQYYVVENKCLYFDRNLLSITSEKVRDYFYTLYLLNLVDTDEDGVWRLI